MLVLEILIIVGFLIFGLYKMLKQDARAVGWLASVHLLPFALFALATAVLNIKGISLEVSVTIAVFCIIGIIAYIIWMLYTMYEYHRDPSTIFKEPTEEEKQKQKEELQIYRKRREQEVREVLETNGYHYSEEALAILFSPGSVVYSNINYPFLWSEWLWHKCMCGLMELSTAEFEERLGYNIQEHTPDEMKPIRYPDHFNIKQALRMGYLAKKGVLMTDLKEMKKFLSYYPYCRTEFLESFGLSSPIDENGSGEYSRELKLMNESPIKKDARGCYHWDYPILKPKIKL